MAVIQLDEDQLIAWGVRIGDGVEAPIVLDLRGDLGAGKTTLARAIAQGAGVTGTIPSPTYNLLFRYPATRGREVVHIDLYRLDDPEEVWVLGWSELPSDTGIVLIEWGERAEELMPEPRWQVRLTEGSDAEHRGVQVEAIGSPPPLPLLPTAATPERAG